ncbi:hypothetical protein DV738_g4801, partial [Chaetothyriales sp. CBS 135597]
MPAVPFKVRAVFEYRSDEPDDLSFANGQLITVTEDDDADWYTGEYANATGEKVEGIFPRNFVEIYEPAIPSRPVRTPRRVPAPDVQALAQAQPEAVSEPAPIEVQPEPGPPAVADKPSSSSFKDRIAAFNKAAAAPVAPFKPGPQTASSGFIKKSFVAPPPSKNSYVPPPPRDIPVAKPYRREEDPSLQQDTEREGTVAASPPPVTRADDESDDQPKPTTLKERIALLQKQQLESAQRQADAAAKKDKPRKPAKKRSETTEEVDRDAVPDTPREPLHSTDHPLTRSVTATGDEPAEIRPPPVVPLPARELVSDTNDADDSGAADTEDAQETSTEEERSRPKAAPAVVSHAEPLRDRMAKMSGGMGMMGMFGPPAALSTGPPRKAKAVPEYRQAESGQQEDDAATARARPVPVMALPGMAPPLPVRQKVARDEDEDDTEDNDGHPNNGRPSRQLQAEETEPVDDQEPQPAKRSFTGRSVASAASGQSQKVDPAASLTSIEREVPASPTAREGRAPPPPPPTGPRPLSGIVQSPTLRAPPPPPPSQPPVARVAENEADRNDEETAASQLPQRRSIIIPTSPTSAPPVPLALRVATSDSLGKVHADEESDEGETEYDGDYDTDIASSAKHKDALKAHNRDSSIDDDVLTDDATRSPRSPPTRAIPSLPASTVQRDQALPLSTSRKSMDVPKTAPPPVPPPKLADDDEYDPYRYTAPQQGLPLQQNTTTQYAPAVSSPRLGGDANDEDMYSAPSQPPRLPPAPIDRAAPLPPSMAGALGEPSASPTQSTELKRQPTVSRRSLDQSRPSGEYGIIASDIDLAHSSFWWTQDNLLPPALQGRHDVLYEVESTRDAQGGGRTTVSKDVFVLYYDYSQTTINATFDQADPSHVQLEQSHQRPPPPPRKDQLEHASESIGAKIAAAANSYGVSGATVGNGSAHGFVNALFQPLKSALKPIGIRAYGALVYANLANASTQQFDEIRPGDIVTFRNAKFAGHKGGLHQKYSLEVGKPDHAAVVIDWDGTKKKIRAWEQRGEEKGKRAKVREESFRVGDLKSGEVMVLPNEVLLGICSHLNTPAFLFLTSTCRTLFNLPRYSRDLLLFHLDNVPGITLGLEDKDVPTDDLWLLLRQRASAHLYGANFHADCSSYLFRSGQLNPSASAIVNSYGHVRIALASRDSLETREFNGRCSPLDKWPSPYHTGLGRVIQVVYHSHFISVLYACHSQDDSSTDSDLPPSQTLPLPCSRNRHDRPTVIADRTSSIEHRERSQSPPGDLPKLEYHLIHYDSHGSELPTLFTIRPPKPIKTCPCRVAAPILIPIHMAVHNRLRCAITWTESYLGRRVRNTSVVMIYLADKLPPFAEEGTYVSFKIYPPRVPPPLPSFDPNANELPMEVRKAWPKDRRSNTHTRPIATAFWHHGSQLAFYSASDHLPFAGALIEPLFLKDLTVTRFESSFPSTGPSLLFDRPFYGQHSFPSPSRKETAATRCRHVHLRLAELLERHKDHYVTREMCVYQTSFELPLEDCPHYFDLDTAESINSSILEYRVVSQRVVARLVGWEPPYDNPTTMSALDTVAISQGGTRIAISYWNKVLVWALQPDALCEEWNQYLPADTDLADSGSESDDGTIHSNMSASTGNHSASDADSNSDSISDPGSAAEPGGHAQHAQLSATDSQSATASVRSSNFRTRNDLLGASRFYKTTTDRELGEVVDLQPIVLYVPDGAVVRKMRWTTPQEDHSDEEGNTWSEDETDRSSDDDLPYSASAALDYPVLDEERAREPSPGGSQRRGRSHSRHYSPIGTPRLPSDSDSDVSFSLSLDSSASEREGGEEDACDGGDSSGEEGRFLQDQGRDGQARGSTKNTFAQSLKQSKGDPNPSIRSRVSTNSGSAKPSEAWAMNKTMDPVAEEEVQKGREDGNKKGGTGPRRNREKAKERAVHTTIQEQDRQDNDYKHMGRRRRVGVQQRRQRREIKGKLPIRDPPGGLSSRSLDR